MSKITDRYLMSKILETVLFWTPIDTMIKMDCFQRYLRYLVNDKSLVDSYRMSRPKFPWFPKLKLMPPASPTPPKSPSEPPKNALYNSKGST